MKDGPDLQLERLAELCRRFDVHRLELFGSAASSAFDPKRSDIDFLVEFDRNSQRLFDDYFGLKEALESLYGRSVDLVMMGAMRNPYFIDSVNATRRLVYAAKDTEAA